MLFTPRPLGPIHDFAADVGSGFTEKLLGEAIPYQVAAALIDELGRDKPTVVVVEDVHWADEATVDVLRLVARRIAAARVLIVLSYRDEALDARHPVRVMLGEVASGLALETGAARAALSGGCRAARRAVRRRRGRSLPGHGRQPYRALVRATFPLRGVIGRIDERVRALYELERVVRAARMQA